MRQQLSDSGGIFVLSQELDAQDDGWRWEWSQTHSLHTLQAPAITSDARFRSDYSVYVVHFTNVGSSDRLGLVRSLDQGSTWSDYNMTQGGGFHESQLACAVNSSGVISVVVAASNRIWGFAVTSVGESPPDWEFTGLIEDDTGLPTRSPQVVSRPGYGEFLATYTDIDSGDTVLHSSNDGGMSWGPAAMTLPLIDGGLALGPLGYRIAGYDTQLSLAEPQGTDPLGEWDLGPTGPGFTSGHPHTPQIVSDPSRGGQWAVLGHREGGTEEQLLFWAEWFDESAGVPDPSSGTARLQAFPNPAIEFVEIDVHSGAKAEAAGAWTLGVYSIDGRLLFERRLDGPVVESVRWNLTDTQGKRVARGVYRASLRRDGTQTASTNVVVW